MDLTIDEGSIFLFDAMLAPGVALEGRLTKPESSDSSGVVLTSHPGLNEAIEKAHASGIFGDCSGMRAFAAGYQEGPISVHLKRDRAAFSTSGPFVFTREDARLFRTVLLIGLSVELHGVTVDEVIALTQSAAASADRADDRTEPMLTSWLGDHRCRTLGEALAPLRSRIVELARHSRGEVTFETGASWSCEIRRVGAYLTAQEVLSDPSMTRPLYGLLYGDEGWAFVPNEHASEELRRFWGSRDYVAILAQPSGVLILNLEERRAEDRAHASDLSRDLSGLTMPHLGLAETGVAGFDHGALFALQRSLLRLLAAKQLEAQLFGASMSVAPPGTATARLRGWMGTLKRAPALFRVLYRGPESRFYKDLLRASSGSTSEIADLQTFMDDRVGATSLLQRLSRAADLVDIELRDRRLTALNWLVVLLTVFTIAIGVLELVAK